MCVNLVVEHDLTFMFILDKNIAVCLKPVLIVSYKTYGDYSDTYVISDCQTQQI